MHAPNIQPKSLISHGVLIGIRLLIAVHQFLEVRSAGAGVVVGCPLRLAFCALSPSLALHPRCAGAISAGSVMGGPPSMTRCRWWTVNAHRWLVGRCQYQPPGQSSYPGRR